MLISRLDVMVVITAHLEQHGPVNQRAISKAMVQGGIAPISTKLTTKMLASLQSKGLLARDETIREGIPGRPMNSYKVTAAGRQHIKLIQQKAQALVSWIEGMEG